MQIQDTYDEQIILLQPRGVFTVPKKLRQGLFDNSPVARITRLGQKLVIEPVRTLSYSVRSYTNNEIDEFFELDDKESKELKNKGLI